MNQDSVRRCQTCVLSSAFPRIEFDSAGVCNYCRNQAQFLTEERFIAKAQADIEKLFSNERDKHTYDAVMCYSGGKDSTYTLISAIKDYNLKVLAFTLDNGFIADEAFGNIHRVVSQLGIDHLIWKPSDAFFKALVRASVSHEIYPAQTMKRISSVCQSCISLVHIAALRLCLEKDIHIILAGFTLGQIPVNGIHYKINYSLLEESRAASLNKLREVLGVHVDDYFKIDESLLGLKREWPHQVNLLCLTNPSENEIVTKISGYGWVAPANVDGCSSNCRLNMFNNFMHQRKYGFNPYELELSHLIRSGKMSRDEAIQKLSKQGDLKEIDAIMRDLDLHFSTRLSTKPK